MPGGTKKTPKLKQNGSVRSAEAKATDGGRDALEPLRLKVRATWPPESNDDLSKDEQAAVADYREHLIGQGWTADEAGALRPPGEGEAR